MKLLFPYAQITLLLCLVPMLAQAEVVAAEAADGTDIEKIRVTYHQAYRGDVPAAELPQAIQTIDSALLQDLALSRFQDALDFLPASPGKTMAVVCGTVFRCVVFPVMKICRLVI